MTERCARCQRFRGADHQCGAAAGGCCQDCGVNVRQLMTANPSQRHLKRGRCHRCYMAAYRRGFAPRCPHCDGRGYLVARVS